MIVCICNNVSERQIRHAVHEHGARTLRDLRGQLGVAGQCGRCADCARAVLSQACAMRSAPCAAAPAADLQAATP